MVQNNLVRGLSRFTVTWFILALFFSVWSQQSFAAHKIEKVGKKQIRIIIDSADPLTKGDYLKASDKKGKATIKIIRVGKRKAIGKVRKGKVRKGMKLTRMKLPNKGKKSKAMADGSFSKNSAKKKSNLQWGALVGGTMNSMSVKLSNSTADMTGMGFLGKVIAELPMGSLFFRGGLGVQTFLAEKKISTAECNGATTDCKTEIMFLSLDGLGRWNFIDGAGLDMWIGLGAGVLFPISHDTNALKNDSVKQTAAIKFATGAIFKMGTWGLPVELVYNVLPPSEDVSTSIIAIQAGIIF